MTPERWQQVEAVLQSALDRTEGQRVAFLDEACGGDPDLRKEVESLLAMQRSVANFMEVPVLEAAEVFLRGDPADSMVGRYIGPYQIQQEIAHGGMGAVYSAFRADDEYQKQVVIKLIKRGMDTDAIIRRFRNERQILANLDHPNIARLIDGGTTEDGLPYFIMDHVEGLPVDVYCDAHKLSILARLKLFRTVCSAVHYAHQHGIIHRDLKPSNIFVTADGMPKLLDFGIAKVLNPESPFQTVESTGLRLMTPDYASPEQVRGQKITPASDVYSLGVLLYELLTGHHPYRIKNLTPQEIERVICEEELERPSIAISRVDKVPGPDGTSEITITPESASATRDGQPEKLRRHLAGDVDKILLMALRKEPERRYASVEQFSEDIRRHLEGQPVIARKDMLGYRSAKFIKRNKVAVLAAALFAVALIALVAVGLYLLPRQGKVADKGIDSVAVLPFVNASADPDTEYLSDGITNSIIDSLSQLPKLKVISLSSVLRYKGRQTDPQLVARELNVRAVLMSSLVQRGEDLSISTELVDVRDNRRIWGQQYNFKLADILAVQEEISREISEKLQLRLSGEEKKRLTKRYTENSQAYQLYILGLYHLRKTTKEGVEKGIEYLEQAIKEDPAYALAYAALADAYSYLGTLGVSPPKEALQKAESVALKAVEIDDALAEAHASLGRIKMYNWDWSAAEKEFKRALELDPSSQQVLGTYTVYLRVVGRFDEAIAYRKRAQELDPFSLNISSSLAYDYYYARQYDQAIEQFQKTIEMDPNYAVAHSRLGQVYVKKGMYEEAIAEFQKAMALNPSDFPGRQAGSASLAYAYAVSGKRGEAQKVLDELKKLSKQRYISPYNVALIYTGLGDRDQAFAWLEKAYEERSQLLTHFKPNSMFDSLRSDPRHADLVRRWGFAP